MSFEKRSLWKGVKPYIAVFDPILTLTLLLIIAIGMVTVYSASAGFPGRFDGHIRNVIIAVLVTWFAANFSPNLMMRSALPIYTVGVVLLIGVALVGETNNGARRWLNLGIMRIQPSEILKIGLPLMLAWYFQRREGATSWIDFVFSAVLLAIPAFLIARQPDLGTAILVACAGAYVIFFGGLSWKLIGGALVAVLAATPVFYHLLMNGGLDGVLKEYQKQRILTLLDPTTDPLGKGFHIIQSTIAVGSGGITGKGWMEGTQTHLEFIPERTTDFIFAVYSEEFGLIGNLVLLTLYLILIARGLAIAANGATLFMRLLAGTISLLIFTYVFVNIGMVSGVLPVVGVPLPWMSYGGTAMVTMSLSIGMLMSVQRHRKMMQS
jgi:rod shape determining protein RodA